MIKPYRDSAALGLSLALASCMTEDATFVAPTDDPVATRNPETAVEDPSTADALLTPAEGSAIGQLETAISYSALLDMTCNNTNAGRVYYVDQVSRGQSAELIGYYFCKPGSGTDGWVKLSAPGATGPTGPQGVTGATGVSGARGQDGTAGPAGPTGSTGATGSTGSTGANGPDGAPGTPGSTGPQGVTGPRGPTGATGSDGRDGLDGAAGASGPTGSVGATGPQGAPGSVGAPGPQGATGPGGEVGPPGAMGAPGPTGAQGPAGAQGPTGSAGPAGRELPPLIKVSAEPPGPNCSQGGTAISVGWDLDGDGEFDAGEATSTAYQCEEPCPADHADCDGNAANGCEVDATQADNACSSALDLGTPSPDAIVRTGIRSTWFEVHLPQACTGAGCAAPLPAVFRLTSPANVHYELFAYPSCGGVPVASQSGSSPERISMVLGSVAASVHLEVRRASGISCEPWVLTAELTDSTR